MEELKTLKNYFAKLQRVVLYEVDFKLFGKGLIKKNKIDDVLCCILATFPPLYKRMLSVKEGKDYHSILSFNLLIKMLKKRFLLNPNVYMADIGQANRLIGAVLKSIEADYKEIEKLYGKG